MLLTTFLNRCRRNASHSLVVLATVGVLFAVVAPVQAQISTDRPGFGTGSTPMDASRFQAESGYAFGRSGGANSHSMGQVLLRYGLTDWLEARAGMGSYVVNGASQGDGYSGSTLGLKAGLLQEGPVSLGLEATTGLPTGTGRYESTNVSQNVTLALGTPIAGPVSFASNVGHTFTYGQGMDGETALTATLLLSASDRVGVGFGYAGFITQAQNRNYVEGGVTFRANSNTQLDVNWAYQVDGYASQVLLGAGIAHRF